MPYRTIEVHGKTYEYMVGTDFTVVRGFALYKNAEIGNPVNRNKQIKYVVQPFNVAQAIKGRPMTREMYKCHHGTVTEQLAVDPYAAEIDEKIRYMINCSECIAERADEI